ncbi:MAG: ATPase, T2SS/T4P/T4SS family [Candidatus Woesearchaeota archaeon]
MVKKEVGKECPVLDSYQFVSGKMPITVSIVRNPHEFVPLYQISIASISKNTEVILERIRKDLINEVNLGMVEITDLKKAGVIEERFIEAIKNMISRHFPDIEDKTAEFLVSYLVQKSLGMGSVEILMDDSNLEEVTINSADEPVWVYHRKHGWLKTNVTIASEDQTRHYSNMIGRKIGRQISLLEPLMDAHLDTGDRVNATLMPISNAGNTITIRKFATKPWTITDFINSKTISASAAALVWLSVQYELSALIAGGTASGKTSMLNVVANFFPPNQRVISIEDTREIKLPKFLHWVPLVTRLPNPEGKGEVSMLDLLVNSLRMRPDRIIVGEIRRKKEAEVLFEAIHTGHSVYATVHANSTKEVITRMTSPPIDVPFTMLPAIQMLIVQYRNRRSGLRRTFQVSEILENGTASVLMQFDSRKDVLQKVASSKSLMVNLEMFTGMSRNEINRSLGEKEQILKWMAKNNIDDIDKVGEVMAHYYTDKDFLLRQVRTNKPVV